MAKFRVKGTILYRGSTEVDVEIEAENEDEASEKALDEFWAYEDAEWASFMDDSPQVTEMIEAA